MSNYQTTTRDLMTTWAWERMSHEIIDRPSGKMVPASSRWNASAMLVFVAAARHIDANGGMVSAADIAPMVGLSRSTVSAALRELTRAGWMRQGARVSGVNSYSIGA